MTRPPWPGCTVGPGCDFVDIATAISKHYAIAPFSGMPCAIQVQDGIYPQTAPLLFEAWASAKKYSLRGMGYPLTLMALAGNVLTVDVPANAMVGTYILSGDKQCPGAFKVLAIAGNQVTVSGLWSGASIATPIAARSIKTVLQFPGFSAVEIWNGGAVLNIADIVCEGDGVNGFGINLQDAGGRAWIGTGMVGFVGFQDNVIGYYNAQINGDGTLVVSNAARDGIVVSGGSAISDLPMVAVNNGRNGIYARRGVVEASTPAISLGNTNKDLYVSAGGVMLARGVTATNVFCEPGGVLAQ